MSEIVSRPEASKKKIHSKDEFELCYIRHQYFRKANINPSEEEMRPYYVIATSLARHTHFTYRNLFRLVGFEAEDLVNIAKVHLVSYLGLFSIEKLPEKYNAFLAVFKQTNDHDPWPEDLLNKNKANFTLFLKQRMEDVVRVCRQKARNVKGLPTEEYYSYYGPKKPPAILRNLVESHEKYGFKKLDMAVYKSIKKKVKTTESVFVFNNIWYVAVPVEHKNLELIDLSGAGLDPYDNVHNMDPEQIFFSKESENHWQERQNNFEVKTKERKMIVIKKFIKNNKKNPTLSEEVRLARKMLKEMHQCL